MLKSNEPEEMTATDATHVVSTAEAVVSTSDGLLQAGQETRLLELMACITDHEARRNARPRKGRKEEYTCQTDPQELLRPEDKK